MIIEHLWQEVVGDVARAPSSQLAAMLAIVVAGTAPGGSPSSIGQNLDVALPAVGDDASVDRHHRRLS
jgi:hypothetical protein